MNIKEFSKESLESLKKQIKEELERKEQEYVLYLNVDIDGALCFGLKGISDNCFGCIDSYEGELVVSGEYIDWDLYEKWIDSGCKVDDSVVEWEGPKDKGTYQIIETALKRLGTQEGFIFDFKHFKSIPYCQDENIKRFQKIPIIF